MKVHYYQILGRYIYIYIYKLENNSFKFIKYNLSDKIKYMVNLLKRKYRTDFAENVFQIFLSSLIRDIPNYEIIKKINKYLIIK